MRVGVPKEIKDSEWRVGLTPGSVEELARHGHNVLVERDAGLGSGLSDEEYVQCGARMVATDAVWADSELVVKVKEPQASERARLRPGQLLFAYLHLAADTDQAGELVSSGATCIAYETVTSPTGNLPLLAPMSEIAGRLAPQVGAQCLEKIAGGRGILLGGVPGVPPAEVVILGGGVSGTQAAQVAIGMGARVTVVDRSVAVLKRIAAQFGSAATTVFSTRSAIAHLIRDVDLLIGTVLIPGAATPRLVSAAMVKTMRAGSVIVDVAIDQGGCCETSRATTHSDPTYVVDGVVHYCVANMPGAVPRTSTFALNNATLPFVLAIANKGWRRAMSDDPHLAAGLNVHEGHITNPAVAAALGVRTLPIAAAYGEAVARVS
jgi:alanine dehydrogenase